MMIYSCIIYKQNLYANSIIRVPNSVEVTANCEFSFQQGIDDRGKASTEVFGGTLPLILPMLVMNGVQHDNRWGGE